MATAFFRTVILYLLLIAGLRLSGKRQIGELEPIELVLTLLISDLASVPMQDFGLPLFNGVIPIITPVSYTHLVDLLEHKAVVAQLLSFYYDRCGDVFEAVNSMLSAVEGAYALGIVCADTPDRVIAARKDAPLLLGCGQGENFLASDVTALLPYTRDVIYMDDGELAVITAAGIRLYDERRRPMEKPHNHIDWDVAAAEKGGYPRFMLKEIYEQPDAVRRAITGRIRDGRVLLSDLTMTDEDIRRLGRILIIACGSSYHVGMVGKYTLERLLRRPVEVCLASEFRYSDPLVSQGDLVIVISQSGETLDSRCV